MLQMIRWSGPYGYLLAVLALLILYLVIRKSWQLGSGRVEPGPQFTTGLNAILFWGAISAVLGMLGQFSGIYTALQAIMRASEISPTVTMTGFFMSFTSTLLGFMILFFSALAWFALKSWYGRLVPATQSA
jgi:uncharacterized membrane protein